MENKKTLTGFEALKEMIENGKIVVDDTKYRFQDGHVFEWKSSYEFWAECNSGLNYFLNSYFKIYEPNTVTGEEAIRALLDGKVLSDKNNKFHAIKMVNGLLRPNLMSALTSDYNLDINHILKSEWVILES